MFKLTFHQTKGWIQDLEKEGCGPGVIEGYSHVTGSSPRKYKILDVTWCFRRIGNYYYEDYSMFKGILIHTTFSVDVTAGMFTKT